LQVQERTPFLLSACELSFPVTTCIAAQGTEIAQSAFARRGYGTLKQLKGLCDAIVNTAE